MKTMIIPVLLSMKKYVALILIILVLLSSCKNHTGNTKPAISDTMSADSMGRMKDTSSPKLLDSVGNHPVTGLIVLPVSIAKRKPSVY
jgi:hypothetical protein